MKVTLYHYPQCGTCRKAIAFLDKKGVDTEKINIVEQPPGKSELKRMLEAQQGEIKKLFNTSGELYRAMKMSEKLPSMSADDALRLLSNHGKLIKRPFLLSANDGIVGFDQSKWEQFLKVNT